MSGEVKSEQPERTKKLPRSGLRGERRNGLSGERGRLRRVGSVEWRERRTPTRGEREAV